MNPVSRIFFKDFAELARSRGLLMLVFVAPVVLTLLIGDLYVRQPATRVAVIAGAEESVVLQAVLDQLSNVKVVSWPEDTIDPMARSVREDVDIVALWDGDWRFFTPLTNRYRLQFAYAVMQDIVFSLERDARLGKQRESVRQLDAALPTEPQDKSEETRNLVRDLERKIENSASVPIPVIRAALSSKLTSYFPAVSPVDRSLVPVFIALIAVFLPFLLASSALAKEREAGTLETLVLAARRNWAWVIAGKLIVPVGVAMIVTLLLLVVARTAYGFGIKPGISIALAVQLLAALVSALLGFSISMLIRSPQDAYVASAVYLVGLILLTGMIYPVDQAGVEVMLVSHAFPLTFSAPQLEAWMTQGASAALDRRRVAALLAQFVVSVSLCAFALWQAHRRS